LNIVISIILIKKTRIIDITRDLVMILILYGAVNSKLSALNPSAADAARWAVVSREDQKPTFKLK
jgi:hypothetical protein